MPTSVIIAFPEKLEILCALARIDETILKADLAKAGIRRSISKNWFTTESPEIRAGYRKKFVEYWPREHSIPFEHVFFSMPLDDFRRELKGKAVVLKPKHGGPPRAAGMDRFKGNYQLVRPHTFDPEKYVLEPLQITVEEGEVTNFMYSHNNAPDKKYLYKGSGHFSSRYYSSLLVREHEVWQDQGAFRCITIYSGPRTHPDRLSGLMLRGVSGEVGGDQAVAVPFIALKTSEESDLTAPDFVRGGRDGIYRVHRDGYVMVGVIDKKNSKDLFEWCDSVFAALKELRRGFRYDNDIVLHTVAPSDLISVDQLASARWEKMVQSYFANGK
jgi:hypothetical protein